MSCALAFLTLLGAQSISTAPFASLATQYDGSSVYFASTLRMKGTSQPVHGKLFAAGEQGVRLLESRNSVQPSTPSNSMACNLGNYFEFYGVETSADGGVIAAPVNRAFAGDCTRQIKPATALITRAGEMDITGIVRLSPNGPYALVYLSNSFSDSTVSYLDLRTGVETPVTFSQALGPYAAVSSWGRVIADDGTALFNGFIIRPGANPQPLDVPSGSIDSTASHVLFSKDVQLPGTNVTETQLNILDLVTSQTRTLTNGNISLAMMSDDGSRVLYIQDGQVRIIQTDGARMRALTHDPAGITEATLSGNGLIAYASTGMGRLIKIDVDSGDQVEIIGRTPFLVQDRSSADAGTVVTVSAVGLPQATLQASPPLNPWLGDLTMWMGERKVPVFSVSPTEVRFIVPWDTPEPTQSPILAEVAGDHSPFDFPQSSVTVITGPRAGVVVHQNWDGFVTGVAAGFTPAHLGEIVHVFAVGLGAVSPEIPSGSLSPISEPLSRLTSPLVCNDSDVLYSGLAPGSLERIYQVDIRLNATGYHKFDCSSGGKPSLALTIDVLP